jgi:hypothetical protein
MYLMRYENLLAAATFVVLWTWISMKIGIECLQRKVGPFR